MENKFTTDELLYISEANATDVPTANVSLLEKLSIGIRANLGTVKEGKATDNYVLTLAKEEIKEFHKSIKVKLGELKKSIG